MDDPDRGLQQLSRREAVAGLAAALIPWRRHTLDDTPKPAPILIGYSVVNYWHTIDPDRMAVALSRAGCTCTEIEYIAWFNEGAKEGKSIENRVEAARRYVQAMRKRNISTMISLVNWNGEAQRAQDDAWFKHEFEQIRKRIGPDRVLLLPVSEPDSQQDGKAYRWTEHAMREWPGKKVGNGDGGRGIPRIPGYDLVDWHHCDDFDTSTVQMVVGGKPAINNTDCGPVINPGPARTRAMARVALSKRVPFLVYGFRDQRIDEDVIAVLGEEIRASRP